MSTIYIILFVFLFSNKGVLSSVKYVERCTRRFTAGYCEELVKPVWTFVFQVQDCVLRMGCPSSKRVNRFRKYNHCMKHCKVMIDLYTQILINDTTAHSDSQGSARKDIDGQAYLRPEIGESEEQEDIDEDAQDVPQYDVDGNDSFDDIVSSKIDEDTEVHSFLDIIIK